MARQRRTQIGGQFAPRLIEMLESPAYRALSLSGHRILDRIEIEMAHHGGTDNGPPELCPEYGPGYYAAFVIDPDGYRIEAVIVGA